MRFKYYLKGLGMGIIITTIIMTVSCVVHNNNLSDQEIIDKAMELGMVMPDSEKESENGLFGNHDKESSNSEEDSETEGDPQSGSEVTSEPIESESGLPSESEFPGISEIPIESETLTETEFPTEISTEEPTEEPTESEEPVTQTPPQHVEITQYVLHINKDDFARQVSQKLYENGMIDSASKFRNYLKETGLDNNIKVGSYLITKGMSYEEIAKIITGKK